MLLSAYGRIFLILFQSSSFWSISKLSFLSISDLFFSIYLKTLLSVYDRFLISYPFQNFSRFYCKILLFLLQASSSLSIPKRFFLSMTDFLFLIHFRTFLVSIAKFFFFYCKPLLLCLSQNASFCL